MINAKVYDLGFRRGASGDKDVREIGGLIAPEGKTHPSFIHWCTLHFPWGFCVTVCVHSLFPSHPHPSRARSQREHKQEEVERRRSRAETKEATALYLQLKDVQHAAQSLSPQSHHITNHVRKLLNMVCVCVCVCVSVVNTSVYI